MKEQTAKLLDKARDSIEAADILLTNNKADIAAGRAYYAMFYIAEALLNEKDLKFAKHGACMLRLVNISRKQKSLIQNIIAGCLTHSISDWLEIMEWKRICKWMLLLP